VAEVAGIKITFFGAGRAGMHQSSINFCDIIPDFAVAVDLRQVFPLGTGDCGKLAPLSESGFIL
jgi:hypothetical protein